MKSVGARLLKAMPYNMQQDTTRNRLRSRCWTQLGNIKWQSRILVMDVINNISTVRLLPDSLGWTTIHALTQTQLQVVHSFDHKQELL